jgi:ribonuclease HI
VALKPSSPLRPPRIHFNPTHQHSVLDSFSEDVQNSPQREAFDQEAQEAYQGQTQAHQAKQAPRRQGASQEYVKDPPQPPKSKPDTRQTEFHDPTEPFTLAPCQIYRIIKCGNTSAGHESSIVVAINSKGTSPAACGIFCNVNSEYNGTFMIHGDDLDRRRISIRTAIAALERIKPYLTSKGQKNAPEAERTTQIIIETSSKWLVKWFAARKTAQSGQFYHKKLLQEFDKVAGSMGKRNDGRLNIKFCKTESCTVAQQLAESMLKGWKEARA